MNVADYEFLAVASLAFLTPTAFALIGAAGLPPKRVWDGALGGLAALGLAGLAYWALGFALQFGGIGLVYAHPGLEGLVWEWSALPASWGSGWGMAGLSGWFLAGDSITPTAYALFLGSLPRVMVAALLPVVALRGRAPAMATLLAGLFMGGVVYPLAGNWVQGGGWLASLGRNLGLGHGLVDFGGAGVVFLVAGAFTAAALLIWLPRRPAQPLTDPSLPRAHLPLLVVVGGLLLPAGLLGWNWADPIQTTAMQDGALRGGVNTILALVVGGIVPLLYTWFVAGRSDPQFTARGVAAGAVASLGVGPFVPSGVALAVGFLAGATVPFVTFAVDRILRLDDRAGVVSMTLLPALIGLLALGLFADGSLGAGFQNTGVGSYLGVTDQGVSGLFVAAGFQPDFPGQLQAQIIGVVALALWGFVTGSLVCAPLAALFHGLERTVVSHQSSPKATPLPEVPFQDVDAGPRAPSSFAN
ncbi:MAG: hypothetical protein D6790_01770 [Caldilineae bacterium]|nr:MAG: hypothetical protein D6790_01770 [Caldilineae bacterium]